jgi:LmbE family N-acetylglucosaminyl deacetylase
VSANGPGEGEARASATDFLEGAERGRIEVHHFRDGFFPAQSAEIKSWFEQLKGRIQPDVIFTHRGDDAHQDHRETSKLTWNTFRDHLILEYEIPKWDGDLGRPNLYVPIAAKTRVRIVEVLVRHFGTQRSKHWFDEETFRGLARLRAMECRAPDRYAEAFHARKMTLI